jgi:hypothetical protein
MLIYIGNLPRDVTLVELGRILGSDNSKVRGSSHRGQRIDKSEYHCILVNTESDDVGYELIEKIDELTLEDNTLVARRYIDREISSGWQEQNRRLRQLHMDSPEGTMSSIR